MKKYTFLFILLLYPFTSVFSQADSTMHKTLNEVTVNAYFHPQPLLTSPVSIAILSAAELSSHAESSLVSAINSIPGVRMEERSPSSYRLSIRGSVLRSPFGIRNIRIYLSDFCLTDAGGNSYLNLIDPAGIGGIQIIKGPEGSVYGANTGGVMIIDPFSHTQDSFRLSMMAEGGSYGYAQGKLQFQDIWRNLATNLSFSYLRADGYRQNSNNQQWNAQLLEKYTYSAKANMKLYLLFSDLSYHTPGGLTLAEYQNNPRAARPRTATLPGATEQKAAIYNSSVVAGLSHEIQISPNWKNVSAVTFSHSDFQNPFITNYEYRNENNIGLRSYFDWTHAEKNKIAWSWTTGIEVQQFLSSIRDYGNDHGRTDTIQTSYSFDAGQYFLFSKYSIRLLQRITVEAGLSLNYNWYRYKSREPFIDPSFTQISFAPQLMPRLAASVLIVQGLAWRISASRGYSPPTLAEVHPSAHLISAGLRPERGWNYETGFRFHDKRGYIYFDELFFFYHLQQAISMRSDSAGNDYFINAGGTNQLGFESQITVWLIKPKRGKLNTGLQLHNSYTYDYFRFASYKNGSADYSGKYLTGVPPHIVVSGINLDMPLGFYLFAEHSYTAHTPLNDANSAYAKDYNLLQCKAGWQRQFRRFHLDLYAGANNLLNEKYSLGNDLNAAGGRYYNAAADRNFYGGLKVAYGKL